MKLLSSRLSVAVVAAILGASVIALSSGATLFGGNVAGANFQFADISQVRVQGNFTGVNFSAANLQNDDFEGVSVGYANFENADLRGSTNLGLDATDLFAHRVCPDGTFSNVDQGTCNGHT